LTDRMVDKKVAKQTGEQAERQTGAHTRRPKEHTDTGYKVKSDQACAGMSR